MKAMVFAAGLGSRLGEITKTIPKALVKVGETTMLQRVLMQVKDSGIDEIVVNVHHHADMIMDYLHRNNNFGLDISISDERDAVLETGGGLNKALNLLGTEDDILLFNADIYTDYNLPNLISFHTASKTTHTLCATLLTSERYSTRRLWFTSENLLRGWINLTTGEEKPDRWSASMGDGKTPEEDLTSFDGIHIISPAGIGVLQQYAAGKNPKFSIMQFYLDVCRNHRIVSCRRPADSVWIDVGKPDSLRQAQECGK